MKGDAKWPFWILILSILPGIVAWIEPASKTWVFLLRILTTGCFACSLGYLVWLVVRKDRLRNYLWEVSAGYFERRGCCFAVLPGPAREGLTLTIYYQNRYECPCELDLLLKPFSPPLPEFRARIACGPAAFGRAILPWSFPDGYAGKELITDVRADVNYPIGRGKALRYQEGTPVLGTNLTNRFLLTLLGLGIGHLMISIDATMKLVIPQPAPLAGGVARGEAIEELWKLGEPELPG